MSKLWIVGCSIAHGVGVLPKERWGALLAQTLGLEPVFLTAEGSSIEWAADQILRADIRANDTVCWGLTTPNRTLWYNEHGQEQHILNVYYHTHPDFHIDRRHLVDLNLARKAVNYVQQVQNYLNRVGCRYAIGYTLPGLTEHREIVSKNLTNTPGFFIAYDPDRIKYVDAAAFFTRTRPVNNLFIDVGTDGFHPGPQQHIVYAEQFLKELDK
jgi:hypothetical protein